VRVGAGLGEITCCRLSWRYFLDVTEFECIRKRSQPEQLGDFSKINNATKQKNCSFF